MRKILLLLAAMALLLSCSDETTYVEYDADPVMVESYKELSRNRRIPFVFEQVIFQ